MEPAGARLVSLRLKAPSSTPANRGISWRQLATPRMIGTQPAMASRPGARLVHMKISKHHLIFFPSITSFFVVLVLLLDSSWQWLVLDTMPMQVQMLSRLQELQRNSWSSVKHVAYCAGGCCRLQDVQREGCSGL